MFLFIALALTAVALLYLWQKSAYSFWTERDIPQAKPTFPFGTFKRDSYFVHQFETLYKENKLKTKFLGLYAALRPMLMVLDLEAIKLIMVKDFQYFQSRGFYYNEVDDPVTAHLFSIEGSKWRALRTKLTPTFTSGKMRNMCPTVVGLGNRLRDTISSKIEAGETGIDMRDMFARFTTDVIGTCAFGLECNSLKDPKAKFREIGMQAFNEPRYSQFVLQLLTAFPNVARKLHLKLAPDAVSSFFIEAVTDTVETRVKNNISRNDFIDLLIQLRNENKSNSLSDVTMDGLSMNEIIAQCFIFFLAGFETSSTASSFMLYEISRNHQIQDKLRTHIRDVLKRHNGQVSYESLKEMTYLEQCINESMRKYPPLPILQRMTTDSYKLPDTNATMPKGTLVAFPVYSIHHDPEIYPDPETYNPDRFLPEEVAARHPFAFLPFGEGPRNCIGERFGMMQAKIGMAFLVSNFRFSLNSKTQPITFEKDAFVLTPANGLFFDVEVAP